MGLGRAIIQRTEITERQLSTVFFINLGVSVIFTLLCYLLSSPLAVFFSEPKVEPVLKVISISFVLYGLNVVQNALLYRQLKFKIVSIISTLAAFLSGIIGIVMALRGYGVWSLVAQNISSGFLSFLFTLIYLKWVPKLVLAFSEVKQMWHYSSRLFASSLVDTAATRLDIFLIGKMFSSTTLGYYTRAQSMDYVVKQMSSASLISVLFPYLSREQHNTDRVRSLYVQYLHVISFSALLISGLLYVSAPEVFSILFTKRWAESAILFKILALSGFVYPVSALMVSVLSARGNSTAFFKLEILKKMVLIPAYVLGFFSGLYTFLYGLSLAYIFSVLLNTLFVQKEIGTSMLSQIKVILPYFCIAIISAAGIYFFNFYIVVSSIWLRLCFNLFVFATLFVLMNYLIQSKGIIIIQNKIKYLFFSK